MWLDKAVDILFSYKNVYSQVHGELSCRFLRISWSLKHQDLAGFRATNKTIHATNCMQQLALNYISLM